MQKKLYKMSGTIFPFNVVCAGSLAIITLQKSKKKTILGIKKVVKQGNFLKSSETRKVALYMYLQIY